MTPKSESKNQDDFQAEQDRYNEELKALAEERYLQQSGISRSRWELTEVPDSILTTSGRPVSAKPEFQVWWDHVDERYEAGDNFLITGATRNTRMDVASAMAMRVRKFQNLFPREVIGYKHDRPSIHGITGEQLSWPYTFQFMDVTELGELRNERDSASRFNSDEVHEYTYEEMVVVPDFFFLTEVGHEWASTWTAKLIEDFLYARGDEKLPVVISLSKAPSKITDKNGNNVYDEISSIIKGWKGVAVSS